MKHRILLIDDEVALLGTMRQILEKQGYDIITAHSGIEAMGIVKREIENLSLVLTDLLMPGGFDGIDLMEAVHQLDADIPVIVITAYGNVETAVKAMQKGAFNFLTKPVNYKVLLQQIEKAAETLSLREENKRLRREIASLQEDRYRIVHASEKMRRLLESAVEIAKTDETVLITGESGTGKELVARHILNESPRARRPFVAFNAAAVHPNLIESELFGFKKGAFTGADRNSPGYVGAAEGGTLFIDEIGEMPTALQPKLLRFMQEREYLPVGASTPVRSDVRVIAATNKDLEKEIVKERFRQDLYYRLSRFTLRVPPLRERREDIPPLVRFFAERFAAQYKKDLRYPDEAAMARFSDRDWPGNIRELEHAVARWVLTAGDRSEPGSASPTQEGAAPAAIYSFRLGEKNMKEVEKEVIEATLRFTGGNKGKTAQMLGISERTIYRKMTGDEEL